MFSLTWILVYVLLGLSTFLNILVPISGSAIVTPLLALLTDPHHAIGLASFFFLLTAPPRIFFFWKDIHWHEVRAFILPSAVAALVGAFVLLAVPPSWLLIIIFLFTIYFLLKKLGIIPNAEKSGRLVNYTVALLSGFLQGTGLAGSDLRNQYLYSQGLQIKQVHGTTAIIAIANFSVATLVRLYTKQLALPDVVFLLYLFPIIVLATWLGKKVLYKLSQRVSDAIVITVMSIAILSLAYKIFLV